MTKIHPSAPPKLIKLLRKFGSFHKLADEINVNVKYIHALITEGKEPTDRTEKGREVRARLFLRRRKRKRAADCMCCGKRVEVARDGTLTSHSRPDGLYCHNSDKSPSRPQSRVDKAIRAMVRETSKAARLKPVRTRKATKPHLHRTAGAV